MVIPDLSSAAGFQACLECCKPALQMQTTKFAYLCQYLQPAGRRPQLYAGEPTIIEHSSLPTDAIFATLKDYTSPMQTWCLARSIRALQYMDMLCSLLK